MPSSLLNIAQNQSQKEVSININFNELAPYATYGWRNPNVASGLTYNYYGGQTYSRVGLDSTVADGTLALTASVVNYVEIVFDTGVIQRVTGSFTNGNLPIAQITGSASSYSNPVKYRTPIWKRQGTNSYWWTAAATMSANLGGTVAHGMGFHGQDIQIECRLINKTAELGYAVSDKVLIDGSNIGVGYNTTNLFFQLPANVQIISRAAGSAGTLTNITLANWTLDIVMRRVACA